MYKFKGSLQIKIVTFKTGAYLKFVIFRFVFAEYDLFKLLIRTPSHIFYINFLRQGHQLDLLFVTIS